MTTLFAQPYDISATGFYFDTAEQYAEKAAKAKKDYGDPVEEFEIECIDGEMIDCALAQAWGLNQINFTRFLEVADEWNETQKLYFIIAVGECGYAFDIESDNPDNLDVDLYFVSGFRELAEQFIEEGLFGKIPENLQAYLDYDAIARDLSFDYSETQVAGVTIIYRVG